MFRKKLKKAIATAMLGVYASTVFPVPAFADEGIDPLKRLVLEVESDKIRDVYHPKGMTIGIYDPYGKTFKLYHYWIAVGIPKVFKHTNTDCTKSLFAWIKVKHPTWKFDPDKNPPHARMVCEDSRFPGIKRCRFPEDDESLTRLYYDESDNRIVSVSPLPGAFCKRIVSPSYLKTRLHIKIKGASAGKVKTYDGKSEIENYYLQNISYTDALDLLARYSYMHKLPYGIMVVQTFDVYQTKSGNAFKKKITYHYVEKPQYYILMAGINAGQPVGYGYNLLNGQATGNNLIRKNIEIYRKSKSGWTGFGLLVFQAALVAITAGAAWAAAPATMNIAAAQYAAISQGAMALAQDIKADVFSNLFDGKLYKTGSITEDALAGGLTGGAAGLVKNDDYSKDTTIYTGDGARHITDRVKKGDDTNPTLSGFYEGEKEKKAYDNWKAPTGGFITLPVRYYK